MSSLGNRIGLGIDRFVGVFFPKAGSERLRSRYAMQSWLEASRHYDAARPDRFGSGWMPTNQRPHETDAMYRDRIRARARDLERNSNIANSVLLAMERHIVGVGIQPQAKALLPDGQENDVVNSQIESLWATWAKASNCDITAHDSIYGLQRMIVRRLITDGEIYPVLVYDGDFIKFELQLIEADALASWKVSDKDGIRILSGVEINDYYRPLAYWFSLDTTLSSLSSGLKADRVDARRVLPCFVKTRPQAVRGMSQFAQSMGNIRDSDEYIDAELMAARIAACLAVFVSEGSSGSMPRLGRNTTVEGENGASKRATQLEPGLISSLPGDSTVFTVDPKHPNGSAGDFVSLQQRLVGAGMGLSYESVSRDVSKTNYSSCRSALLEDDGGYKVLRQYIIDAVLNPLWETFVDSCVISGKLNIRDYFTNRDNYIRVKWIPPAQNWVDPLKEVQATQLELSLGINTRAEVCASKGRDWREVAMQNAKELELMNELGIKQDDTAGAAASKTTTDSGKNEDKEEEGDGSVDEE